MSGMIGTRRVHQTAAAFAARRIARRTPARSKLKDSEMAGYKYLEDGTSTRARYSSVCAHFMGSYGYV